MFCQYNNIYTSLHKYLKEKRKTKKKKKTIDIVATVPLGTVVTFKTLEKKKGGSRNQSTIATMI